MPTYEYECPSCEATFERFQPITAKPIRTCPACGGRRVRRLLGTGGGILFRGSGFYQTDYRSAEYQRQAKAETEGASGGSKTEKPSDSPAKKSSDKSRGEKKAAAKK
jgi:putative FmdB family regulatory protein